MEQQYVEGSREGAREQGCKADVECVEDDLHMDRCAYSMSVQCADD